MTVSVAQIELDEGGSRDYTVVLDSQPTGPVTVTPALLSGCGSRPDTADDAADV